MNRVPSHPRLLTPSGGGGGSRGASRPSSSRRGGKHRHSLPAAPGLPLSSIDANSPSHRGAAKGGGKSFGFHDDGREWPVGVTPPRTQTDRRSTLLAGRRSLGADGERPRTTAARPSPSLACASPLMRRAAKSARRKKGSGADDKAGTRPTTKNTKKTGRGASSVRREPSDASSYRSCGSGIPDLVHLKSAPSCDTMFSLDLMFSSSVESDGSSTTASAMKCTNQYANTKSSNDHKKHQKGGEGPSKHLSAFDKKIRRLSARRSIGGVESRGRTSGDDAISRDAAENATTNSSMTDASTSKDDSDETSSVLRGLTSLLSEPNGSERRREAISLLSDVVNLLSLGGAELSDLTSLLSDVGRGRAHMCDQGSVAADVTSVHSLSSRRRELERLKGLSLDAGLVGTSDGRSSAGLSLTRRAVAARRGQRNDVDDSKAVPCKAARTKLIPAGADKDELFRERLASESRKRGGRERERNRSSGKAAARRDEPQRTFRGRSASRAKNRFRARSSSVASGSSSIVGRSTVVSSASTTSGSSSMMSRRLSALAPSPLLVCGGGGDSGIPSKPSSMPSKDHPPRDHPPLRPKGTTSNSLLASSAALRKEKFRKRRAASYSPSRPVDPNEGAVPPRGNDDAHASKAGATAEEGVATGGMMSPVSMRKLRNRRRSASLSRCV
ncbi:hypothetical protein ACHAWF_012629 [Thalassiosira exigua]